ncbi:hypothetical protein HYT02_00490 [Candidatus Gottesmanbacteria bacterium]|nr:hypothetical protein [Candidatus Gottesmanbacteria bacterium]
MLTKIDERVSVKFVSSVLTNKVYPETIYWRGRVYKVSKVGLHHFYKHGRTLKHIFSVISGETAFRLSFDTESLQWKLEEVSELN